MTRKVESWLCFRIISISMCFMLLFTGMPSSFTPHAAASENMLDTLFSDGFEGEIPFDQWVQEGVNSQAGISTSAKFAGEASAKLDGGDLLRTVVDTSGYENVVFSYYYKTGSNYSGSLSVQYSVDDGLNWVHLDEIGAPRGSFEKKEHILPQAASDLNHLGVRFVSNDTGTNAVYIDEVTITGYEMTEPLPSPEGPVIEIYAETFDDPDNFGSEGGVTIPHPWLQEGSNKSVAKTSVSNSAPSTPNRVKIDSADSLALPLIATGYGNITLSYYTTASSYTSGSIVVEWSGNSGTTWTQLEEFMLSPGTVSQGNTLKSWTLDSSANNNPAIKFRFRVGEAMQANMYVDSVVITGQRIPGIEPVANPIPMPDPVETPPFVPPAGVIMHEDVEIGMAGNRKLYTSIAVPEAAPSAPMPVMIYIHGGGWNHGDRKSALSTISNYVRNRGYIGVSLSYRLTPEAPFPAQIQDIKLALRFLRANAEQYHIDPSRIGVWGSSAGGHLAALLGTTADLSSEVQITLDNGNTVFVSDLEGSGGYPEYSTRVQAVADWFGPADFTSEFANNYSSVTKLLGGHPALTVPNEARLAMPGTYASPDDPPIWIRHGTADNTVPYQNSEVFAAQLNAANVPVVDFQLVEGQGHGFVGDAKTTADAEAWAFMDQHVKNRTVTEPIIYKPGHQPDPTNPPDPTDPPAEVINEVSSLLPSDDAMIDSANVDVNYNEKTGGTTGLFSVASSNSRERHVYFKYDVSETSSPEYKYTLNVSAKHGSTGTDVDMSVFAIEDTSWSEAELTWNNAPVNSLGSLVPIGSFTVTSGTSRLYEIDVTDYVRSRLFHGQVAFLISDTGKTGVSLNIYTKETSGSNPKPKLVVTETIDYSNDHEPPVWPDGASLAVHNIGTDFVNIRWPNALDNTVIAHYRIYRQSSFLETAEGAEYTFQGLSPGEEYTLALEAVDVAGNRSLPLTITRSTLEAPITPLQVTSVTASGSDGNPEFNAVDNNLYTRWSAPGANQWIQLDLGEMKQVGYAGIAFYKGDVRRTGIWIDTSPDGINWTRVHEGTSSGKSVQMQAFDFQDAEARFVRITGNGNSDNTQFTSLTDIHLYPPFQNGDTPVAIVPNIVPTRPDDAIPFTKPGMREADGTEHLIHLPHATTGRVLNVVDYGADPADNDHDDRAAIQAAINAAVAGDEVFLPNGIYNLSSTADGFTNLQLKSEVNFRGESEAGTVLKTSLNKVRNSIVLKSSSQHHIVISNLTLTSSWDGEYSTNHQMNNPSAGGPDTQIAIVNFGDNPSSNITIDQVTVEKYIRMGIRIDSSHDVVVRNSTFRKATDVGGGGAGYGVSIQGIAKVDRLGFANDTRWNLVEDSTFEGPYLRHGALIQFVAHNNVIRNNRFDRNVLDAIDLHGELEYLNEIYGNHITNIETGAGIALGNTGGTAPSNHSKSGPGNYIHSNWIQNAREGIKVHMGTPDTVIKGNVIEDTLAVDGAAGIKIQNGPGTIIRENVIRRNAASNYWGIVLEHDYGDPNAGQIGQGDPHQVQIIRNKIEGNTNGLHVQSGTEITLRGNELDNTGTNYLQAEGVDVRWEELRSNADLNDLAVSAGTLAPAFSADVLAYTVQLANSETELELSFQTADDEATVRVNGETASSETIYHVNNLEVGHTVIELELTAENGNKKQYTITINRAALSNSPSEPNQSGGGTSMMNGKLKAAWRLVEGKRIASAKADMGVIEKVMPLIVNGIVRLSVDTPVDTDEISVELTSGALQQLKDGNARQLVIDTPIGAYELPIGDHTEPFFLTLRKPAELSEQAKKEGQSVLGAVEFKLMARSNDNQWKETAVFSEYVARTILLDRTPNVSNLAVVRASLNDSGELNDEPVPFRVEGRTVKIFSRTNSVYMVLEQQVVFHDMESHWAKQDVQSVANKRIVKGVNPSAFRPDSAITRAEFVATVMRALGLNKKHSSETIWRDITTDDWHSGYINAAVEAGIANGYDDQTFRPNGHLTRQEMAVIIYRAMRFAGYAKIETSHVGSSFADEHLIEDWAHEAVRELTEQNLLRGVTASKLDPNGVVTRAQSAAIVNRMLANLLFDS